MRTALFAVALFLFFSGSSFADGASPKAVVQGNQGYVYGTPPKAGCQAGMAPDNGTPHPIGDILHAVKRLDDWIKENLW